MQELTKKELAAYFKVYRDAFPDWKVEHEVVLTRTAGPIAQFISFQGLSYGAYRPECMIDVYGPPDRGSRLLYQMLDVKHRQVERRQHATEWPKVLRAIKEQFVPDARKPLEIVEVLRLAEEEAEKGANVRYFNGVAMLNAYLERFDRAAEWCGRAVASLEPSGDELVGWQRDQADFARQLNGAIEQGRGEQFVAELIGNQ